MISTNLRIVAIVGCLLLLLFVIDLVRRRRLKEEYSALWVIVAVILLILAASSSLLRMLTHAIGAVSESSALYFFGLLFVVFLLLNFSIRVSVLERRLTALVQEIALRTADHPAHPHDLEETDEPQSDSVHAPAEANVVEQDDVIRT